MSNKLRPVMASYGPALSLFVKPVEACYILGALAYLLGLPRPQESSDLETRKIKISPADSFLEKIDAYGETALIALLQKYDPALPMYTGVFIRNICNITSRWTRWINDDNEIEIEVDDG